MQQRFELIVFDWDGTLMDSAALIVASVQAAARDLGLAPPPIERARHIIGLGLNEALRHALPDLPEAHYPELVARYRHHYLSRDHELTLFPGAADFVQDLAERGYRLAVATGKSRLGLDRALAQTGLDGFFHATRCADECHSKPHPQMLLELMEEFAVEPAQTLMIGDTTHDLMMAANAGTAAVAVTYGAHARADLEDAGPLYCADSIAALAKWLADAR
ncbi:HAD-IIIA family hydrolase [Sulfuricystis multivorans]|uniref:HAD-IIIA family hydrolase n=1 Tax=Sulfuricystis multivorans TaxID=2211108 RepID=UPI000F81AAD6|nr:HAD-IIIA family hydrolase [Sulfuricystis multivorans]